MIICLGNISGLPQDLEIRKILSWLGINKLSGKTPIRISICLEINKRFRKKILTSLKSKMAVIDQLKITGKFGKKIKCQESQGNVRACEIRSF